MRNISVSGALAFAVLLLSSLNLCAQQQAGVKVIESTDATGKVVKGLGVGAVTNSEPAAAWPNFSSAPCSALTSSGGKKNYLAMFTSPCNLQNSKVFQNTNKVGTVVNLSDGLYVNWTRLGGLGTGIAGCNLPVAIGSIYFGANNSCTSFALASDGTTTAVNAPSGGEVSILNGGPGGTVIASFNAKQQFGANFHTPVYMFGALTVANGNFQVDGSGNVSASGTLKAAGGQFTVDPSGNVQINGNLNVAGQKNFQIDDPLDPANRYLYHSAVESSEMMNIYTGNVTTNEHGEATVQVPAWFQALNGDFRYQLTVIGQFAQAIVASEIRDSKFSIKTDKPGVKVSWQVTGVRQDAYAKAHPLVVEQEKPASERGSYLHPELYGAPESKGINYARQHPAPVKEVEVGQAN